MSGVLTMRSSIQGGGAGAAIVAGTLAVGCIVTKAQAPHPSVTPAPPAAVVPPAVAAPPAVAGSPAPRTSEDPPARSLKLDVRVHVARGGRKLRIASGGTLRGGELFDLLIRPNQPAYVYVVQASANGSVSVLFPESGDRLLSDNQEYRIPTDVEEWYQVVAKDNEENIFLLTARAPLTDIKELIPYAAVPSIKKQAIGHPKHRVIATPPPARSEPAVLPDKVLTESSREVVRVKVRNGPGASAPSEKLDDGHVLLTQLHFRRS